MLVIFCVQRWYIDGTVECFVEEHAPLAILAILALLFCVLVTLLTAAIVMRKIKVCNKLSATPALLLYHLICTETLGVFNVKYPESSFY